MTRRQAVILGLGLAGSNALVSLACSPAATTTAVPAAPAPPKAPSASTAPTAAAATTAPAAAVSTPAAKTRAKVTVRLDFVASSGHQAYFFALDKGFFAENGLDVEIGDGKGSSATLQTVGGGTDSIGLARATSVIQGLSKGVPVKSVASWVQRVDQALGFPEKNGIRTPKDLEGKTILVTPGGAADDMLPYFFRLNHVDPAKVTTVTADAASKYTLVAQGKGDAATGLASNQTRYSRVYGPEAWGILAFGEYGVTSLDSGLIVHEKTMRDDPQMVRSFLAAMVKAWDLAQRDTNAPVESFRKLRPDVTAEQASYVDTVKWQVANLHTSRSEGKVLGWAADDDWKDSETSALEAGLITQRLPVDRYFTNEFLPAK